jgi:hypothetical protein
MNLVPLSSMQFRRHNLRHTSKPGLVVCRQNYLSRMVKREGAVVHSQFDIKFLRIAVNYVRADDILLGGLSGEESIRPRVVLACAK